MSNDLNISQAEFKNLQEENEALRIALSEKISSAEFTSIIFDKNIIDAKARGNAIAVMAGIFGRQLADSGAENYIEMSFWDKSSSDKHKIVVTIKREQGLTPHQLRMKAESECEKLRDAINKTTISDLAEKTIESKGCHDCIFSNSVRWCDYLITDVLSFAEDDKRNPQCPLIINSIKVVLAGNT